jgi:hypothetical protein
LLLNRLSGSKSRNLTFGSAAERGGVEFAEVWAEFGFFLGDDFRCLAF